MAFFRSADWDEQLIENNIIPNYRGNYIGIGALRNSDVLTAVSIVGGDVARFPIIEIQDDDDTLIENPDLMYLMNKKANEYVSAYTWKFSMVVNAILCGNSYSRIVRDPKTRVPVEFQFFSPSQTEILEQRTAADVKYQYKFTPVNGQNSITCKAEDVIHMKFFTTDTIMGRSPLLSLKEELALQTNGVNTLQKFFGGGFKSGMIKAKGKLNKKSRRKIREDFEYAQAGSTNGPIITDETMDYTPLEVDTNVLSLINSNNWSTSQIAKVMRIPAFKLGVNSPNQSVKQLQEGYVRYDLPFYFEPIISEFQLKLLNDSERQKDHFEFDIRKEVGMNMQDAKLAIDGQILSPNEAREAVGQKRSKNANMDKMQSNLNNVFLDDKSKYQMARLAKGGGNLGQGQRNTDNSSTS